MCASEKRREIECVCVSCRCMSAYGGVMLCVKGSPICDHVYAPMSLNLYMFE